jgi:truncated hemoglobin YjbI
VTEVHRHHVAAWWCEVFGGPSRYTDELGGYEAMLGHHKDRAITPEQRSRFASLMSLAADDAELPSDPEFRSALVAYLEWAPGWRCTTRNRGLRSSSMRGAALGLGRSASVSALGRGRRADLRA